MRIRLPLGSRGASRAWTQHLQWQQQQQKQRQRTVAPPPPHRLENQRIVHVAVPEERESPRRLFSGKTAGRRYMLCRSLASLSGESSSNSSSGGGNSSGTSNSRDNGNAVSYLRRWAGIGNDAASGESDALLEGSCCSLFDTLSSCISRAPQ